MKSESKNDVVLRVKRYRDEHENHHVAVRVRTADGGQADLLFDMAMVNRRPDLKARLLRAGISNASVDEAISTISESVPDLPARLVLRPGWVESSFVMATGKVHGSNDVMLHPNFREPDHDLSADKIDVWSAKVVKLAKGAPLPLFAILHALAAPLYRFSGLDEGVIFHFHADSSTGKTSIVCAGVSVYGPATGLDTWDATRRGLFERAARRNDHQLVLDDTSTQSEDSRKATQATIYQLVSGKNADQAMIVHDRLPPLSWTLWGISTGEVSMKQQLGTRKMIGLSARIIDIPVPAVSEGGVWWTAKKPALSDPARRSAVLKRRSRKYYGHAMDLWVRYLVAKFDDIERRVERATGAYLEKTAAGATGIELRMAKKFALVYAAGVIAIKAGVLDCEPADVFRSVASVMKLAMPPVEDPTAAARRVLLYARGRQVVPRFEGQDHPRFPKGAAVVAFIQKVNGRRLLHVKRDQLDSLLGPDAEAIRKDWEVKKILMPTASGEQTKQQRILVGNAKQKPRFIELDMTRLKALFDA
jgi:hypothetical protein